MGPKLLKTRGAKEHKEARVSGRHLVGRPRARSRAMPSSGVAAATLVLRSSASLNSESTGVLEKGTAVAVLDVVIQKSGAVRALVALKSDAEQKSIGWVTSYKGGVEKLKMGTAAALQDGFFTSAAMNYNSCRQPSPERLIGDYRERYETFSKGLSMRQSELTSDDSPTGERSSSKRSFSKGRASSSFSKGRVSVTVAKRLPPVAAEPEEGTASTAESKKKEEPEVAIWKAARLHSKADELTGLAEAEDGKTFDTIQTKLVELLALKKKSVDDLIREWDRNGDGGIDFKEFRVCMRGLGGDLKDIDVREIDGLYEMLDTKKEGEIKTPALKAAIKKMQNEAAHKEAAAQYTKDIATKLRASAELYTIAADLATQLEGATEKVQSLSVERSIDSRLGEVLRKRNIKIGEVVTQWDKDRGGSVDLDEFTQRTKEIGLKADPAEVKDLFERWDDDLSGELEIEELKEQLQQLQQVSADEVEERKAYKKMSTDLTKQVRVAQIEAEQAVNAMDEERMAHEAAVEQEAAAKREREVQRQAEKLAAEKAEKAATAAKIEAMRVADLARIA